MLRVYLLRANRSAEIVAREEEQLKDLIRIAQETISTQRQLSFSSHIYRRRKYSITTACSKFISQPSHVCSDEDLTSLFKPLLDYLDRKRKAREQIDRFISMPVREKKLEKWDEKEELELHERVIQVGAQVKIQWTQEELSGTGWTGGWYKATVNSYDHEADTLTLTYSSEPGVPYEKELLPLLTNKKIKLIWSPI